MFERTSKQNPRPDVFEQKRLERRAKMLDTAYKKAQDIFDSEDAIDPLSFENYDQTMVEADLNKVRSQEALFRSQETPETERALRYSAILEAIIHEQIELSDWLGPEVMSRKASRFDDIFNGVDSIAEFQQEHKPSYLALSLDVTYGHPEKKLKRIRNEIDHETLSQIKYFESSDGSFKGSLKKVPRVVIGADFHQIERLADLWVNGKKKELAEDPMQLQILDEVAMQLRSFQAYATRNDHPAVAAIYQRQLELIRRIMNAPEKIALRNAPGKQNYGNEDRIFNALRAGLKVFERI